MSGYLSAIGQGLVFFPLAALLLTLPYIAWNYRRYGSVLSLRILIVYSFILYLICAYCLVIFPLPSGAEAAALSGHRMQLVPFSFLADFAKEARGAGSFPAAVRAVVGSSAFLVTGFNLLLTLPFGVYLRYYFGCGARRTLLFAFLLSLFFELTQLSGLYGIYPGSYRLFDVDDLIVNTAGSMLGYALEPLAARLLPTRAQIDRASMARSRHVSLLRRFVALGYDGVVWLVRGAGRPAGFVPRGGAVAGLLSRAGPRPEPLRQLGAAVDGFWPGGLGALGWTAYLSVCPMLLGGQTVGHRLTRLRIVEPDGRPPVWYQYPLRYGSLMLVLGGVPRLAALALDALAALPGLPALAPALLQLALMGLWMLALLFEVLRMAMREPLFYERFSHTRLVTTIRPPRDPDSFYVPEGREDSETFATTGHR